MARHSSVSGRSAVADTPAAGPGTDEPRDERDAVEREPGTDQPAAAVPVTDAGPVPVADEVVTRVRPARVSAWATLGLVVGLVGLCAALTGPLAPEGFALGVLGLLASIGGLVAARRPGVTGTGVAQLGLLFGIAAVVLAVLAMTGQFSWLNSHTDQVGRWHAWLVAHWSWLGRW